MGDSAEKAQFWSSFCGDYPVSFLDSHGLYRLQVHDDPRDIFGGLLPFHVAIYSLAVYHYTPPLVISSPPHLFYQLGLILCWISTYWCAILFDHNVRFVMAFRTSLLLRSDSELPIFSHCSSF